MSTAGGGRLRTVATVATAVALVAGCGQAPPVVSDQAPVVVAESVPFEGTHLSPRPTPAPGPDAPPEPPQEPSVDTGSAADAADDATTAPAARVGPSRADAAAFVASESLADLEGLEHAVVDLDGDTWDEVVATGMRDSTGQLRIAWWTADGYQVLASDQAGSGRDVTDLRAADVNEDDRIELLVQVEGEGLRSLALWSVVGRGRIQRLEAVGGCHDGTHVFGVTTVRLQQGGAGPPAIVADCDESPLPVADWSEHRWTWQDGAYQHVRPEEPADDGQGEDDGSAGGADTDGEDGDDGEDDEDDGPAGGGDIDD